MDFSMPVSLGAACLAFVQIRRQFKREQASK
jgi:hypothetical protein